MQSILDHFFIVKLVNVPRDDKTDRHHFTAKIVIKKLFPFDNNAMIEGRCHIYIGDSPVIPENFDGLGAGAVRVIPTTSTPSMPPSLPRQVPSPRSAN